jgi:hypothetical protein
VEIEGEVDKLWEVKLRKKKKNQLGGRVKHTQKKMRERKI